MAEVLLKDVGPNGNIQAVVEATSESTYFYLYGATETNFSTKAVWVRNHVVAPDDLDAETMQQGQPPTNPAAFCQHANGLAPLSSDQLVVTWLPEGNGAALFQDTELLAIIPPWSGIDGFYGYAKEAIGEGPVAWELSPDNQLQERFQRARDYWTAWEQKELWSQVQTDLLAKLESTYGPHDKYFAIDGGHWPPKALVQVPTQGGTILFTVGVSLRPQPNVELATETFEMLHRIELASVLPTSWSEEAVQGFASFLSGQSNLPWDQYTWLGPGHTLPCQYWQNPEYAYALLVPHHPDLPRVELGELFGSPVNQLWLLPISAGERNVAMDKGSERLISLLPKDRWRLA